jgi:hypothetical protein
MLPNQKVILDIMARSGTKDSWSFLSVMKRPKAFARGKWQDFPFQMSTMALPLDAQIHECDLFFTPLSFSSPGRNNDHVELPGVLFADLDAAPELPEAIPPSVLWETSPGMKQAVWYLDKPIEDYNTWADLNQRLTHYTGADPGGWMGSKVLRVPGSVNWKRRAFGSLTYFEPSQVYTAKSFDNMLPVLSAPAVPIDEDHPHLVDPKERQWLLRTYWPQISLRGRSMIRKERVNDRSLHIVRTARELLAGGLGEEAVFHLLWTAPWNKWRTDRHRPDQLWTEVQRAAAEVVK